MIIYLYDLVILLMGNEIRVDWDRDPRASPATSRIERTVPLPWVDRGHTTQLRGHQKRTGDRVLVRGAGKPTGSQQRRWSREREVAEPVSTRQARIRVCTAMEQ